MLESRGIGVGSSPIGCEGFVKASKVQGSSLLLSNANNFVRYSYVARDFFFLSQHANRPEPSRRTPRILAAFPSGAWAAIEKLGTGNASGHNAGQAAHVRTSGHTFLVPGTAFALCTHSFTCYIIIGKLLHMIIVSVLHLQSRSHVYT